MLNNPTNSDATIAYNHLQYGNKPSDLSSSSGMVVTSADMRALGFTAPGALDSSGNFGTGGTYDGIIWLNSTDLTGFGGSGDYSPNGVIQHETDEVLGIGGQGSYLNQVYDNNGGSSTNNATIGTMDLFRYAGSHTPSFITSSTASSYFSIDGGVTNIVSFNQDHDGDYGDWGYTGNTGDYVQNAFTGPDSSATVSINSPEGIALQAVGYDTAAGLTGWRAALLSNPYSSQLVSAPSFSLYASVPIVAPEPEPLILLAASGLLWCLLRRPTRRQ